MLTSVFLYQILTALFAGIIASFSPCVYPLLPITLSFFGTQSKKGRNLEIILFSFGQFIVFFILGMLAVFAGEALGFSSESPMVQLTLGFFFIFFGVASFSQKFQKIFSLIKLPSFFETQNLNKWGSAMKALLFGMGTSLLVSPCTTPILSGILTMASTKEHAIEGSILMLFYSLGFSLLLLVLGLGLVNIKKLPKAGKWMNKINVSAGIAMIAVGAYYCWQGITTYLIF